MVKKLLPLFFFFPFFVLQADILVEPYVGVSLLGEGDARHHLTHDSQYRGFFYGGRLGYRHWGLSVGADRFLSSFKLDSERDGGFSSKDRFFRDDWGIFVAYRFPVLLNVWAKWIARSELEGKDADNPSRVYSREDKFKGSGRALGLGWTGLASWVSINLEYRSVEYDEYKVRGMKERNYENTLDLSDFLLSVSLPLDF